MDILLPLTILVKRNIILQFAFRSFHASPLANRPFLEVVRQDTSVLPPRDSKLIDRDAAYYKNSLIPWLPCWVWVDYLQRVGHHRDGVQHPLAE
jgi:hypothetical protein